MIVTIDSYCVFMRKNDAFTGHSRSLERKREKGGKQKLVFQMHHDFFYFRSQTLDGLNII